MRAIHPKKSAIHHGDCVELLEATSPGWARLAFADPPFNIGYKYDSYDDAREYREYVAWSRRWIEAAVRALTPDGSLYIAIGDEYAAELRIIGRELGLTLRNWIIWHYGFGQNTKTKFARSHAHVLYFVRDPKQHVFNDSQLRFPSLRHTEYGDRRANPAGRLPDDVWNEFPRVCGTFAERQGWHGCQMPEALLMRIIRASSLPDDTVLDPFSGSGTTASAAVLLGRVGVGIEQSAEYVESGRRRLELAVARARTWRAPTESGWSDFERQCLKDLYRETETPMESLAVNEAAMNCIAACLEARTGRAIEPAEIRAELERLYARNLLPRFKNDRPFQPKRYRKAAHAPDRKLTEAWFAGVPSSLKKRNEHGQSMLGI